MTWLAFYAPRHRWLALLADGWRLPWIVEPMHGHHGDYSVLMTREDDANTEKLL